MLARSACEVVLAQVVAVEQDAALVGIVEPREQLHERRLARAVLADERQHLARVQGEAQVAHRPALGARDSGSPTSSKREALARSATGTAAGSAARRSPARSRRTRRGRRGRAPGPATCEKPISRSFEQVAQAPERAGQEREVADGERRRAACARRCRRRRRSSRAVPIAVSSPPQPARRARELPVGLEEARRPARGSARSGTRSGRRSSLPSRSRRWRPVWRT